VGRAGDRVRSAYAKVKATVAGRRPLSQPGSFDRALHLRWAMRPWDLRFFDMHAELLLVRSRQ
jgi:hypothetical protein